MNQFLVNLVIRHKKKGVVIDTNLFLLYLIGSYDSNIIPTFKRTKIYSKKDFVIFNNFIKSFDKIITTPNILTEVSNLTETINKQTNNKLYWHFKHTIEELYEKYYRGNALTRNQCFIKFGFTDSALFQLAKEKYLIVTDDLPLYHYLETNKLPAINFNHLRNV